jgi:hypothetical protein
MGKGEVERKKLAVGRERGVESWQSSVDSRQEEEELGVVRKNTDY